MRNAECGLQSSAAWSPFWQCYAGARRVPRPQHSADMKSRKISGAKIEGNALRAETARAPQQCMDAPGRLRWSRQPGGGTVWWGEAADEPARADARATENANCTTTRQP